MKTLFLIALLAGTTAQAQPKNYFLKVTGMTALEDHHINQYDDEENPPQAFDITFPTGYRVIAADVDSGGSSVCSVTGLKTGNRKLTIEALDIETDAGTCIVTLTVFEILDKKEFKVKYSIEQTGT